MLPPHIIKLGDTEWVIRREFVAGNRGPCYIAEINRLGRRLLDDGSGVATLNDPRFGGLWGFGCIVAAPPSDYRSRNFWSWAWDLTTRLSGFDTGFGVTNYSISDIRTAGGKVEVDAAVTMSIRHQPVFAVTWRYSFTEHRATCQLRVAIVWEDDEQLYLKEPKITANGLSGFRMLSVSDAQGKPLKPTSFRLATLKSPSRKTQQIGDLARHTVKLTAPGSPALVLTNDLGFDTWRAQRDAAPPLDADPSRSPIYCLKDGKLKAQWEIVRNGNADRAAVIQHVDEGGSGAPDCLICFRPLARGAVYEASLSCRIV